MLTRYDYLFHVQIGLVMSIVYFILVMTALFYQLKMISEYSINDDNIIPLVFSILLIVNYGYRWILVIVNSMKTRQYEYVNYHHEMMHSDVYQNHQPISFQTFMNDFNKYYYVYFLIYIFTALMLCFAIILVYIIFQKEIILDTKIWYLCFILSTTIEIIAKIICDVKTSRTRFQPMITEVQITIIDPTRPSKFGLSHHEFQESIIEVKPHDNPDTSSQDDSNRHQDIICSICLNEEQPFYEIKKCHHQFHYHCLREWSLNHSSCPLCKAEIK